MNTLEVREIIVSEGNDLFIKNIQPYFAYFVYVITNCVLVFPSLVFFDNIYDHCHVYYLNSFFKYDYYQLVNNINNNNDVNNRNIQL